MTPIVRFKVSCNPVPQGRPRIIKRGQHYGMKDHEKSRDYKDMLRLLAHEHRMDPLLVGPLRLELLFEIRRPQSCRKRDVWRDKKPDLDNLIKAVTDAMTGVIWRDDAQIVALMAEKPYSDSPGVTVTVWRV